MIKRSSLIASAAVALSLILHFLGLAITSGGSPERAEGSTTVDTVALGNAFEDVAEPVTTPVEPERAPEPEPPVEPATPEPESAEIPVTKALVASSDPQQTFAPDTGTVRSVVPGETQQSASEEGRDSEPETAEPTEQETASAADAPVVAPVEPSPTAQKPTEAPVPEPAAPPAPQPEQQEQIAALPAPVVPAPPVISSTETSEDAVIPLEPETVEPEPEGVADGTELAVTASIRPRLPENLPPANVGSANAQSNDPTDLRFPDQVVESPLTTYQRDGFDAFARRTNRSTSGSGGSLGSRGPGNSDVTNYAGRVLMHLNRTKPVFVSARGFARVFFEINPDGTLSFVDVIDSSGSQEINRAAKAQVKAASPFPPPPNGARRKFSFYYQLN